MPKKKSKVKNVDDVSVVEITQVLDNKKVKPKLYLSFKFRLFSLLFIFITIYLFLYILLINGFTFYNSKSVNVNENGNVSYSVLLKENDFYENTELEQGMIYVSNLIDSVNANFNYSFISDSYLDSNFNYSIKANLLISDNSGSSYFKKEYVLLENKTGTLDRNGKFKINENLDINYKYYNDLASYFKSSYGINAESKLIVYLDVNKDINNISDLSSISKESSKIMLTIPLTEKSVNIKLSDNKFSNYSKVLEDSGYVVNDITYIIISVILVLFSIYVLIKIIKMFSLLISKKTKYDRYIGKLLREYDRLIVETTSFPNIDKLNLFSVNSFSELLDVRDNLRVPIMFYIVSPHIKSKFYIKYGDDLYLLTIKAVDLEK